MKRNFYKLITAACLLLLSSGAGAQLITTVAGTGVAGTSSAGGPATMQQLLGPTGVAYDFSGFPTPRLFIADSGANLVRMVDMATGAVSVFAGGGTTGLGDGKPATLAQLVMPTGVSTDGLGNVFIADLGDKLIRKVDGAGIITSVAGCVTCSGYGDGGFATAAQLNEPYSVKANASGLLYITDRGDDVVRLVNALGIINTIAGIKGTANYQMDGGVATSAEFNAPAGITIDNASGSIFVTDRGNNVIRKIAASGIISTIAGNNYPGYKGDAPVVPATNAQFSSPSGIVYRSGSPAGNLFICDAGNNVIRRYDEFNKKMLLHAGNPTPISGAGFVDGGTGVAKFRNPMGICVVAATGELYVADKGNNAIRYIDQFGVVKTIAGNSGTAGYSGDGGLATNAQLNAPQGVALNAAGDKLYVADAGNDVVRVIDLTAPFNINIVAGTPGSGIIDNGDFGPALLAAIPNPTNVILDAAGNIYITSTGYSTPPKCGNRVRMVEASSGNIFTYYGNIGRNFYGGEGVVDTGFSCGFAQPEGIVFNSVGDLLIASTNDNRIEWRIDSSHPGLTIGRSYTIAGNGTKGYGGQGVAELLNHPTGATNSGSNTYIADRMNHVIRRIDSRGVMSTMVGIADSDGYLPAPYLGTDTRYDTMSYPCAVAAIAGTSPALYMVDAGNSVIRKVDLSVSPYTETKYAGQQGIQGYANALVGTNAQFKGITGIDVDPATGDLYVTERGNNDVRKISGIGSHAVTTVAGTPPIGGLLGGGGPATASQMNNPYSVAADTFGNVFVADRGNNIIRKIDRFGVITTFAGTGTAGFSGDTGPATTAQLSGPSGISIVSVPGPGMIMYIADQGNNRIRKVDPSGIITTFAGQTLVGNTDGTVATAKFYYPTSVVVDATNTKVYVADGNNHKVRLITAGNVSSYAGSGTTGYTDGVSASTAQLADPKGLALDASGNNLYIADFSNNAVRKVNTAITTPTIVTVAGQGPTISGFTGDGVQATATALTSPAGVWIDPTGNLFISDFGNERVRRVDPSGIIQTVAGNGTPGYSGDGGPAVKAQLYDNFGICVDTSGSLFIADRTNNVVRKVTPVLINKFTESATSTCQDSCVTFISNSIGTIDSKTWSVSPSGPTISAPNSDTTSICFPANGSFTITFTITSGSKTATSTTVIDVSATPHPPITRTGHFDLSVPGTGYGHYQWYSGTTLIPGAVVNTFTAPALGVYSVEVDSNGCNGVSTYTVVSTTNITKANNTDKNKYWLTQQGSDNSSVMIYSSRPVDAPLTVTMFDATGRAILDDKWSTGSNIQVKAASLAPGMYLIKLTNDNTSEVLKWLKN